MVVGLIIAVVLFVLWIGILNAYSEQIRHSRLILQVLYWYHVVFFFIYYFAFGGGVDSRRYFNDSQRLADEGWFSFLTVGTDFVKFLTYPLVNYLNLGYESIMILFAFIGLLGIFFFYLVIVENIRYRHRIAGIDLLAIFLFLPNLHIWSVSLGKGSLMTAGLGIMFYGISNLKTRLVLTFVGAGLVFMVRPHLIAFGLAGGLIAYFLTPNLTLKQRTLGITITLLLGIVAFNQFSSIINVDDNSVEGITEFIDERAGSLSQADSGVDISNYSQPMRLFTFLYRPLFVDAPNAMGYLVSLENLFYFYLSIKLFLSKTFYRFLIKSRWVVKSSFFTFFLTSLAMAQIMTNMGIALRQKAQFYMLFLFVVLCFADYYFAQNKKPLFGE